MFIWEMIIHFISDYPSYIRKNNTDERIVVDVASNIINSTISFSNNRSFMAKMIHEGKKIVFARPLFTIEIRSN